MKTILMVILAVAVAGLGGLGFYQHKQLADAKARFADVSAKLSAAQDELANRTAADDKIRLAEQKAKILQDTLKQTSEVTAQQSEKMSALEESLAAAKTNSSGLLGNMLKDPAMKDMIKAQQKAVIGPMIDRNYSALFKQLNLTPGQETQMKELLQQKMMVAAEMGLSMLDGSADAEKRKEMSKQIKDETAGYDQKIKDLLGSDNYKSFEGYEKTIADRMAVGQFKDQLSSSTPLDAAQEQQLIQTMSDARSSFKWTTDYNNQSGDMDLAEMFTEERMNQHAQEQAEFDRQLLLKVQNVMKPDQFTAFQKFLETQRNMQLAAMKMAGAMFGAKK